MPSIEGGGVEKNLFIISNYLSSRLDKVILVTASKEFNRRFKNIKIISPKINLKSSGRNLKYIFCLFELFKIFIKNRQVSILSFQANLYCIILSKIFNNKIIVRSNSSPSGWSKNFIKRKLFKIVLNFADTIIVNSESFKKEFKDKFNLKTVKIYNPLNKNEIIKLSKKKIKFPFFKKRKELKIINIGRFTDQKDHITLLKSIDEINNKINLKLLIIGRGINLVKMKEFIKKRNLEKNVKILDFKKNPYPYLRMADMFILTSKFEGLPNVLLEASALKKFIVSTDCPTGPNEIVLNNKSGFLCKVNDFKDISKKIFYFYNHQAKYKNKFKNYNQHLKKFDFNENLKKYFYEIIKITK